MGEVIRFASDKKIVEAHIKNLSCNCLVILYEESDNVEEYKIDILSNNKSLADQLSAMVVAQNILVDKMKGF